MRPYRLRVYDGIYEVLSDRILTVYLDLDDWPTVSEQLNRQLTALTLQARRVGESMDAARLEVWNGAVKILDWTGV